MLDVFLASQHHGNEAVSKQVCFTLKSVFSMLSNDAQELVARFAHIFPSFGVVGNRSDDVAA